MADPPPGASSARVLPILAPDCFNELARCRDGPMLYNRHDIYVGASLRKYGEFSPGEAALFAQLVGPGDLAVEVGANIGVHTLALSRLVGPHGMVLAFEPQRLVFQTLCANLALNGCPNVTVRQIAIGAAGGSAYVPVVPPDQPANFGGVSLYGNTEGERVALAALDDFGLPTCQFLKLDLEGMEVDALLGATRLVAAHRPVIYVENDRDEHADALVGLLRSWGYRLFWHCPPLFVPDNFAGDSENIFGDTVSLNMLCLPAEHDLAVDGLEEVAAT